MRKVGRMKDDSISRQAAIDAIDDWWITVDDNRHPVSVIKALPSAQPEITPDGTLKVTVDADIASIGRILLSQTGTQYGGLYYKDAQPEITLESAIDYLHSIGWMQEHDRVLSSAQQEYCDTCKHGYFGDGKCDYCRVRFPSHYERRTDGVDS